MGGYESAKLTRPQLLGCWNWMQGRWGGYMTALVVGLVSIAVIWLVVIYGSIYLNKNVQ
jgi:hypothetical protein